MKRELKPELLPSGDEQITSIAKPIPMKRELKQLPLHTGTVSEVGEIAKPIPMKRELKLTYF